MTSPPTSNLQPRPIVLLGPTAGGKSELAVALAERLGALGRTGEVIGADSMQVYRHMDAGTAKPDPSLRARAVHHMIDIVEPTERFTVHDWLSRVEPLIERLQQAGKTPIIVGGTNLYLKALLEGMFDGPARDAAFRATLRDLTDAALHDRLQAVDPAARIAVADRKRTVRALEVHHLTGRPISDLQSQWGEASPRSGVRSPESDRRGRFSDPRPARDSRASTTSRYRYNPILIGLNWPREQINRRINARVKRMFFPPAVDGDEPHAALSRESLPDEARRLEAAHLLGLQAREALGYKQMLDLLHGTDAKIRTLDDAFERTKILTRRFAKQQRTWLRRFRGVTWLDLPSAPTHHERTLTDLAGEAMKTISRERPGPPMNKNESG